MAELELKLVKVLLGAKGCCGVDIFCLAVDLRSFVAIKRAFLGVIREKILAQFGADTFHHVTGLADDAEVTKKCMRPLHPEVEKIDHCEKQESDRCEVKIE